MLIATLTATVFTALDFKCIWDLKKNKSKKHFKVEGAAHTVGSLSTMHEALS